jgi:uncharacterized protein (DUF427 family)
MTQVQKADLEDVVITGDRPGGHDSSMLIEPTKKRVRHCFSDIAIADSVRVKLLLEPSDTWTRCPYKGEATYWHVRAGGQLFDDLAWSYREPHPGMPKDRELSVLLQRTCRYVCGWSQRGGTQDPLVEVNGLRGDLQSRGRFDPHPRESTVRDDAYARYAFRRRRPN